MNKPQALIPQIIDQRTDVVVSNLVAVTCGVLLLSLLAQISIPLPWTPVPITGQTFGVAFVALLWGRSRALAILGSYLLLGGFGLPIFAAGKSGFLLGPTSGYLVGMLLASFVMGSLADKGWTKSFLKTWLAAATGSLITFSAGLFVLSFFVPSSELLMAGLIPFLPGDFMKTLLVATITSKATKTLGKS